MVSPIVLSVYAHSWILSGSQKTARQNSMNEINRIRAALIPLIIREPMILTRITIIRIRRTSSFSDNDPSMRFYEVKKFEAQIKMYGALYVNTNANSEQPIPMTPGMMVAFLDRAPNTATNTDITNVTMKIGTAALLNQSAIL